MRYAEHECADCGGLFPANQLVRITSKVLTGESVTPQRRQDEHGVWKDDTRRTSHYSYRGAYLCLACKRARFRRALFLVGLGAIALTAFWAWASFRAGGDRTPTQQELNSPVANEASLEPDEADAATDTTGQTTDAAAPNAEQGESDDISDEDVARINDAVRARIVAALETGEAQRWDEAGVSGYVTVSAATQLSGRVCRNVSGTVDGASSTQIPAQTWCQSNSGGEWAPSKQ